MEQTQNFYVEDIKKRYEDGEYKGTMEYPKQRRYMEKTIFDENKSVKWNREEVARRNAERDQAFKEYREEESRQSARLTEDCIQALMFEYKFNRKQAEKIHEYTYREKHDSMNDFFIYLEEFADLCKEVAELKE